MSRAHGPASNTCGAIASGRYLGTAGRAGAVVCLSPDGKRLVGDLDSTRVLDLATGVATDLMALRGGNANPIWSPDGKYVAISWGKRGWGIYRKPSTGAGEWEPLTLADDLTAPEELVARRPFHPLRSKSARERVRT